MAAMGPTAVLDLGDNQYESGTLDEYRGSYDRSWGGLNPLVHPAPGNHEYNTTGASGYYTYFGAPATPRQPTCTAGCDGYYSFDIGAWHVIALNAQCGSVGGCGAGSPEEVWLKNDLAAHRNLCTLAYWHQPRFSSGAVVGSNSVYTSFWQDLYNAGAELVLNGHAHSYERFTPQTPNGTPDAAGGVREFIVGTGGRSLQAFGSILSTSEAHDATTFGVLKLTLHPGSYDWSFMPSAGGTFTDSGSASCHDVVARDTQRPTAPTKVTANVLGSSAISLAWAASSDNVGVTGYGIYRDGVRVASTSATTYQDGNLAASTSYSYQVTALDSAGNESAKSSTVTATTQSSAGGGSAFTFTPTDDATIARASPSSNYGASSTLIVDGTPVDDFLLKFNVSTGNCSIARAALKITVDNDGSASGGAFATTDPSWRESTVTWNSAPPAAGTIGSLGPVAVGTTYSVDLTNVVKTDGLVSLRASATSPDGAHYYSKEGSSSRQAKLLVSCL
jgi:chitodextrinase